eukprot:970986-Rhodomonas_salina.1
MSIGDSDGARERARANDTERGGMCGGQRVSDSERKETERDRHQQTEKDRDRDQQKERERARERKMST